jgi:hypothetical protein
MIKDVVVHNGLLRIATGTFVCMVGHSELDSYSRGIQPAATALRLDIGKKS